MTANAPLALGNDLLLYNSDFHCVICKLCEYAVQPAAISRHLKQRHKIYRKDREDILELIAHLHLVDPAHIQHHEYGDPVPYLAILRGLYCTAEHCSYLCESLKRMQQHWAATHDKTGTPDSDWRPTLMQTFFRGTCTRYFRVRGDVDEGKILGQRTARSPRAIAPKRSSMSSSENNQLTMTPTSQPDVNLPDLSLFYQYVNITSKTVHCGTEPTDFWTTTVPQVALQNSYLMHGILATSAMHIACLHPKYNALAKQKQLYLGSNHQNAGLPGFRAALEHPDASQMPFFLGFSKLLLLQRGAALQCIGMQGRSSTGLPGCESWRNAVDYLRFTRSNTAVIFSIMRFEPMRAVMRFVPRPPYIQSCFDNPSLEPMRLLREEIMRPQNPLFGRPEPEFYAANRAVLLEMWHHFSNVFAIEYHSESRDRCWEAIIYLSSAISQDYLDLLESQNTHAMLLLAYYSVVIGFLAGNWWLADHAQEVLAEVKRHTPPLYWHFIEWPRSQVEVE